MKQIDGHELIEKLRKYRHEVISVDGLEALIDQMPSAQPEREKGKWIVTSEFEDCRYVKCNQCKVTQVFYYNKPLTNFCPNCGADMRGKNNGKTT